MITFVTFHVDLAEESLSPETPIDSSRVEYREILSLMLQSVSIFHDAASRRVVLTDEKSVFTDLPNSVEIQRYKIDPNHIMLSRLYAQLEFLKSHDFSSNIVFLDTDILVNENLETSLGWSEFDIALTIRDDPQGMPINGGIIFVSNRRPQIVLEFFKSFYERYVDSFSDQSQWWGDQRALADILTHSGKDSVLLGEKTIDETCFHLLPCETYNYSPDFEEEIDIYGADLCKKIIHFKGKRKRFMKPFWENCISKKLCHPDIQIDALRHQISSLQVARQQLKKDSNSNRGKYLALLKKKNFPADNYFDLKERYAKLKERYIKIKERYAKLEEQYAKLEEQYAKLEEQYGKIRTHPLKIRISHWKNWLKKKLRE